MLHSPRARVRMKAHAAWGVMEWEEWEVAAAAVEAAVERGAVLVASAAEHRLFGVEVDVGHHW